MFISLLKKQEALSAVFKVFTPKHIQFQSLANCTADQCFCCANFLSSWEKIMYSCIIMNVFLLECTSVNVYRACLCFIKSGRENAVIPPWPQAAENLEANRGKWLNSSHARENWILLTDLQPLLWKLFCVTPKSAAAPYQPDCGRLRISPQRTPKIFLLSDDDITWHAKGLPNWRRRKRLRFFIETSPPEPKKAHLRTPLYSSAALITWSKRLAH